MTQAASLVASLRTVGISIGIVDGRLLVEAPRGTITPDIRAQLVNCKAELVATLEFEEGHVTMASPIGRALLGKAVGEMTQLRLPTMMRTLKVVELTTIHDATPDDL